MIKYCKFELNLINILFFYIFGVCYFQFIEKLTHVKITEIIFLISIIFVLIGILQRKIKINMELFFVGIASAIYLIVYYFHMNEIFSYVYPPIFLAILFPLYKRNKFLKLNGKLIKTVSIFSFIYLFINLVLYLLKINDCFQVADRLQFKGVLPHSNLFCSLMICLFSFNFYGKDLIRLSNRILCTLLIFATASRTYIVVIVALWIIRILTAYGKRYTLGVRLCIFLVLSFIFGPLIVNLMIKYIPSMARFVEFGFTGNGRQYLSEAYSFVINKATFFEMLFGVKMTENYMAYNVGDFPHSFTENSFIGIFLLFGIVGAIYFGYYIIKTIFAVKDFQTFATILVFMISLTVQDSLLSVQAGISIFTAVYFMILQSNSKNVPVKACNDATCLMQRNAKFLR